MMQMKWQRNKQEKKKGANAGVWVRVANMKRYAAYYKSLAGIRSLQQTLKAVYMHVHIFRLMEVSRIVSVYFWRLNFYSLTEFPPEIVGTVTVCGSFVALSACYISMCG